jgi:Kef-type K+ transport system membrane component KefB
MTGHLRAERQPGGLRLVVLYLGLVGVGVGTVVLVLLFGRRNEPERPLSDIVLDHGSAASGQALEGGALVARIFLAVAAVLVAARLVGMLFGRVRLAPVMGEIVAGILLGPSLLGAVWPSASEYLFPPSVTNVLQIVGQFGLIFFMFLVGLEVNRRLVRGLGHQVVLLSHVSIVAPFALGTVLAVAIYPRLGSGPFSGFALFLGAAMAITAFPVLARILTDSGLHRTSLGALALTCAAVDDLTAWCILAGVVALVGSNGPGDVAMTLLLTAGFMAFMLFVGRPSFRRIALELRRRGSTALLPCVLVGLLLSAWATEMIGIHAIFGAFLFGVSMPRSRWIKAELHNRLEDVTLVFLLPIFFAVVGLSTRISLLDSVELWLITVAVIAVAVVGKLGGSMLAARFTGYGWRQSAALGLLMNTRGLTEIVILTIGQRLGIISPTLFAILVLMALATTIMATPLLSLLYPPDRILRESVQPVVAPQDARRRDVVGSR